MTTPAEESGVGFRSDVDALNGSLRGGAPVKTVELRKQISIFVPLSDWRAIRKEAARLRIPMTELCRRWMKPDLTRLRRTETHDEYLFEAEA